MASVKVELYKWKTLKNGEHPIILRIIQNRKRKIVSLGYSCSDELWDKKNQLPKKKHPLYNELIVAINHKKLEASKVVMELNNEQEDYSTSEVYRKIHHRSIQREATVFNYLDETYERLVSAGRIGYANVFKDLKRVISNFRNKKDLEFTDIDFSFFNKI